MPLNTYYYTGSACIPFLFTRQQFFTNDQGRLCDTHKPLKHDCWIDFYFMGSWHIYLYRQVLIIYSAEIWTKSMPYHILRNLMLRTFLQPKCTCLLTNPLIWTTFDPTGISVAYLFSKTWIYQQLWYRSTDQFQFFT